MLKGYTDSLKYIHSKIGANTVKTFQQVSRDNVHNTIQQ